MDYSPTSKPGRVRGLSLIELLVALAITAMLLTATMLAIDASFKAYAAAAESASTQTTTRLVINRVLALIRTKTAYAPLDASKYENVEDNGRTLTSNFLILKKNDGQYIRIEYKKYKHCLMLQQGDIETYNPDIAHPLLGGVTQCEFRLHPRLDSEGVRVLDRASIDFTVTADDDATLDLEKGSEQTIRVVASTMPRRLE